MDAKAKVAGKRASTVTDRDRGASDLMAAEIEETKIRRYQDQKIPAANRRDTLFAQVIWHVRKPDESWCPIHNISYSKYRSKFTKVGGVSSCPLCYRDRMIAEGRFRKNGGRPPYRSRFHPDGADQPRPR